jgi:glutamate N-acetyltransferase / amino-acid N-acetyltransferase
MEEEKHILTIPNGNVCSPIGFKSSGVKAGLKQNEALDLALIFSECPAVTAGVFTANIFTAAPVQYCRNNLTGSNNIYTRAVIANSGNANACTGEQGYKDAITMTTYTAERLNIDSNNVLVASTGRIGVALPMNKIAEGIEKAVSCLSFDGGHNAAKAIMTTDTRPKEIAVQVNIDGKTVTVAGMAKGAGMIAPKLTELHATMLAFITTDANVSHTFLKSTLLNAANESFNRISVDGDMSTNDSLFIMANGKAENNILEYDSPHSNLFANAVKKVARYLAKEIVKDGEGSTKCVTLEIENAATDEDAKLCAEAIANSLLCKTAWFGHDPNWGRIVAAAGYSGALFAPDKVNVYYNHLPVVLDGNDAGTPEKDVVKILETPNFTLKVDLSAGTSSYYMWTNDISYEYVKINADYHT